MKFELPQIIYSILYFYGIGLMINCIKNPLGKTAKDFLNREITFLDFILCLISPLLIWWGDFFDTIKEPQLAILVLFAITFINTGVRQGRKRTVRGFRISLIFSPLWLFFLIWGGFYG